LGLYDAGRVLVAERDRNWIMDGWESNVTVLSDLVVDLAYLLDQAQA